MIELLQKNLPSGSFEPVTASDGIPTIYVARERLVETMRALRDTPALNFRFLADMVGIDCLPREPRFEIVYLMADIGTGGSTPKRLRVKVRVPGNDASVPTLTGLWKMADWAERELWDMFGIRIEGHADLRRILMPEDWEGFPQRRDYPVQIKQPVKTYEPLQVSEEEFIANIEASRERSRKL
jgi:NADH-quinone oxidoreductase subunit C